MSEHWEIFMALAGLVAAWSVIIIAALRVMFGKSFKNIDEKLRAFNATSKACTDLERELLELKAAMPLEYVRREDFIRFEVGINYKLDKLRDLFLETFSNREKK